MRGREDDGDLSVTGAARPRAADVNEGDGSRAPVPGGSVPVRGLPCGSYGSGAETGSNSSLTSRLTVEALS